MTPLRQRMHEDMVGVIYVLPYCVIAMSGHAFVKVGETQSRYNFA